MMIIELGHAMPDNAYPRDVTSPGPYQQRGVARSQKSSEPSAGRLQPPQPPPKPETGDAPKPTPDLS